MLKLFFKYFFPYKNRLKVQLTAIFFLMKSIGFSNYFSEKLISIDKIPAILQAFKVVIPVSHDRA